MQADLRAATEFIQGRLYLLSSRSVATLLNHGQASDIHYLTVDDKHVYEPFYRDFGPVHLGHTIAFCRLLRKTLNEPDLQNKKIVVVTSFDAHKRANAAYLMCSFMLMCKGCTPEEAFEPFNSAYPPFIPFRDASQSISTYNLTILDCLKGLNKAILHGFLNIDTFNAEEYFHYEKVENGDMNWIVPGRFLAFSSPASRRITPDGMIHFTPDDYVPIFRKWNITAIVRLNKKMYDSRQFTRHGFYHEELFYPDGGLPPEDILQKFMALVDEWFLGPSIKGAFAVHCKAGLGRTGSLIGLYMMKYYRFTAAEAIGWLRICRPGSVIGIQQHYLKEMQLRMWKEGENIWKQNYALISEPLPANDFGESKSYKPVTQQIQQAPQQSAQSVQSVQSQSSYLTQRTTSSPSRVSSASVSRTATAMSPLRTSMYSAMNTPSADIRGVPSPSTPPRSTTTTTRVSSSASPLYSSSPYKYSTINRDTISRTSYETPPSTSGSLYTRQTTSPGKSYGSVISRSSVSSNLEAQSRTPPVYLGRVEQDSPTRKGMHTSLSTGKFESNGSGYSKLTTNTGRTNYGTNLSTAFIDMSINARGAPMKRDHQLSSFNADRKRDNFLLRGTEQDYQRVGTVVSKPAPLNHYANHNPVSSLFNERSHSSGQW